MPFRLAGVDLKAFVYVEDAHLLFPFGVKGINTIKMDAEEVASTNIEVLETGH